MQVNTRKFGEIDISDDKIINFPEGIVGFSDMNQFTLIFDEEKGSGSNVKWLQSLDAPEFAMPVMDPLLVNPDYNPEVEEALLDDIGGFSADEIFVLVTLTVPREVKSMSVNLKAPFIIHAGTRLAKQVILESDYPVKFPIYDILQSFKK